MTNIMDVIDACVAKADPPTHRPLGPRNPYLNSRGVFSDPDKGIEWDLAQVRERRAEEDAINMKGAKMAHLSETDIVAAARKYASLRQAFPSNGWQDRIEQAGWELSEMVRAYDNQVAAFTAKVERGDYCPVCHNNPNQQGHGPRCTQRSAA